MSVRSSGKMDADRLNLYFRQLRTAVENVPGVQSVAATCALPLQGACYGMPMQIAGRPIVDRANRQAGFYKIVSPSYFNTLDIRVIRGRALSDRDVKGAPPSLVINQRFAERNFPNNDALGQRILIEQIIPGKPELGPEIPWEIVGIVANEKLSNLSDDDSAGVYVSNEQSPVYGMSFVVRTTGEPLALQKSIAAAIHGVNKDQPIANVRTLEQIREEVAAEDRIEAGLLAVFGAVALGLAAIGIYGVMSYSVAQRTQELGIRAALGAPASSLRSLVLNRGLILTAIGLTIGAIGALGVTRGMEALLYNVSTRDPFTMVAVAGILAIVAATACLIPAMRATRVDPLIALRHE